MISAKELDFVKAHEQFQRMCEFLDQALSEGQRVDQVERGLFRQAMTMCLELLRSFVEAHGDGDRGKTLEREGETLDRLCKPHEKRYLSIFGELLIDRWVYPVLRRFSAYCIGSLTLGNRNSTVGANRDI